MPLWVPRAAPTDPDFSAAFAPLADPLGLGCVTNAMASAYFVQTAIPAANFANYTRLMGADTIDALRLFVVNSSGNIEVSIYADDDGYPGARVLTSGSVACPAGPALAEVSLGGSVTITHGSHWARFSADNTTATFLLVTSTQQVLPFPGGAYASAGVFAAPANAPAGMDPFTMSTPVLGGVPA